MKKYAEQDPRTIVNNDKNNNSLTFSDGFLTNLNENLNALMEGNPEFTQKEINQRKEKYTKQILDYLTIVHIEKIACGITFEAFSLLNLFKALDKIINEAQFIITPEGIFIEIMDPSRICLIRILLKNSSYKYYGKGKFALNIEDLKNILSCEKNDKSQTTLEFGNENLFATINSQKFGSKIPRTLNYLELELEEIPPETLRSIKYPFQFSLEQYKFIQ